MIIWFRFISLLSFFFSFFLRRFLSFHLEMSILNLKWRMKFGKNTVWYAHCAHCARTQLSNQNHWFNDLLLWRCAYMMIRSPMAQKLFHWQTIFSKHYSTLSTLKCLMLWPQRLKNRDIDPRWFFHSVCDQPISVISVQLSDSNPKPRSFDSSRRG